MLKSKNIVIVGSGAVAAELTSYIADNNKHPSATEQLNILGYLDSKENVIKYWSRYNFEKPVLGDIDGYKISENDNFLIGIGHLDFRNKVLDILKSRSAKIVGFVHYSAIISNSTVLGTGNIVYPHCILGPNTILGEFNLLTSYSFVSHDCRVGDNNFFSTAGLSGNVVIGNNNFFGIRATVLPKISIGSKNIIQAGMIVDKDISDNCTVFHRFKEKVIVIKSENDE